MTFALPYVGPNKTVPRLIGGFMDQSGTDAPDQRFTRAGSDRFAVDIAYPPMTYDQASTLVAALLRAQREEVLVKWPQPGLVLASPGQPGARTVDTLSSANATVVRVAGGVAYVGRPLQAFNVIGPDGRRYLHLLTQSNVIPGDVFFSPPARIEMTPGLTLDFATPMIQGFVQGKETAWSVDVVKHYGVQFTVKERK